jgi:hypothetical protein
MISFRKYSIVSINHSKCSKVHNCAIQPITKWRLFFPIYIKSSSVYDGQYPIISRTYSMNEKCICKLFSVTSICRTYISLYTCITTFRRFNFFLNLRSGGWNQGSLDTAAT